MDPEELKKQNMYVAGEIQTLYNCNIWDALTVVKVLGSDSFHLVQYFPKNIDEIPNPKAPRSSNFYDG